MLNSHVSHPMPGGHSPWVQSSKQNPFPKSVQTAGAVPPSGAGHSPSARLQVGMQTFGPAGPSSPIEAHEPPPSVSGHCVARSRGAVQHGE